MINTYTSYSVVNAMVTTWWLDQSQPLYHTQLVCSSPYLHWSETVLKWLWGFSVIVLSRVVVPHFTGIAVKKNIPCYTSKIMKTTCDDSSSIYTPSSDFYIWWRSDLSTAHLFYRTALRLTCCYKPDMGLDHCETSSVGWGGGKPPSQPLYRPRVDGDHLRSKDAHFPPKDEESRRSFRSI